METEFASSLNAKCGNYVATGLIATHGYFRESQKELKLNVPIGIATICSYFVDIYLSQLLGDIPKEFIVINHKIHETKKLTLMNGRWDKIKSEQFQKKLLMDIMVLDHDKFLTELECGSSKDFGINGCKWLQPFLLNIHCHNINYINLSNCDLNEECIKIISQSLIQSVVKNTDNNDISICLDLSNNKEIDDKCIELLMPLLFNNILSGLHLKNNHKITNKSVLLFKDYFNKYDKITNCWFIDLRNTSIKGKEWEYNQIIKDLFFTKNIDINNIINWNGIWKSNYGPHGVEYQLLQTLINKSGKSYLSARKITGDENVPCGKTTWYLNKVPKWIKETDESDEIDQFQDIEDIAGKMQIRSDIHNDDGFTFDAMSGRGESQNVISRTWIKYNWQERGYRVILS